MVSSKDNSDLISKIEKISKIRKSTWTNTSWGTVVSKIIEINILGRDFQINCPDGEEEALLESAKYLNQKVDQLKDSGVTGFDRLLLMASLNIIHESANNNPENLTQLKLVQEKLNNFDTILDQALSNY